MSEFIMKASTDEQAEFCRRYSNMQELVRCSDCKNVCMCDKSEILPGIPIYAKCTITDKVHKPDWFCADGVKRDVVR